MIKKHFNLPMIVQTRLSQASRQLLNQTRVSNNALSEAKLIKVSESLNDDADAVSKKYVIGNSYKGRSYTVMGGATLFLLQIVMLMPAQAASAVKSGQQRVLMIEMTPALCSLQPTRSRMRQCLEGYSLTVSGLDMGYEERCGRGSEPRLTPLQLKVVNRIMPDTTVRSQVWQRYGACSPLSASSYFRQITNYASALKLPNELNTGNSYTVSKSRFIGQMTRLNTGMPASSIDLICQAGSRRQTILTDVHVCYAGSEFGSCREVVDNCGKKFIISGGK